MPIPFYVYPPVPFYGYGYDYGYGYPYDSYYAEPCCPPVEEYVEYEYGGEPLIEPAPQPIIEEPYDPEPGPLAPPPADEPAAPEAAPESPADPAPQDGPDPFDFGVEAFQKGDYEKARGYFRGLVDADATDGEAWMALLQTAFILGRYDEAAESIAQSAQLGIFQRGYRFDPRTLFEDPATFDAALVRLDKENTNHPRNMDAWLTRAYYHVAAGESAEAQAAIQRVLRVKPRDPTAPVLYTALLPAIEEAKPR